VPIPTLAANVLWAASSLSGTRRYRAALRKPDAIQRVVLARYLRANSGTSFGQEHRFARIRSVEDFQATVPVAGYDDLQPLIGRVAAGERDVLTRAPVEVLAPSSGSTAAVKLIPYTNDLRREISRAVDVWITDLYLRRPRLMAGRAYWSITPAGFSTRVPGAARKPPPGPPIGFDDDSEYLGGTRRALARAVLAVPSTVAQIASCDAFHVKTLEHLLLARDLRLISVWHPSFLTQLLDALETNWARLLGDVARIDRRRSKELHRLDPDDVTSIWPNLELISCWGDGPARPYAADLARRLPHVEVQPKGLIATEGIVTIPFRDLHPLAIRSHFFEFLGPDEKPRLAHEVESGVDYHVVLTTGGGLYRYALGDRVTVDGWVDRTPSLRFVGKEDRVSDRFGEKLSDGFVATVLDSLFSTGVRPRFAMLAPEATSAGVAYTLFIESSTSLPSGLSAALERGLRRNPHYAWCVDLGQLRPARVQRVGPDADRAYLAFCAASGQRLGDVKPVSLHAGFGWRSVLPC
jgi:hypothetical protein